MLLLLRPKGDSFIGVPGSGSAPRGLVVAGAPRGSAIASAPRLVVSVNASRPKGSVR